jgi:hypothetical protein
LLQGLEFIINNKTPAAQHGACWPHDAMLEVTRQEIEQAYGYYKAYRKK